jgi:phage repressor protein C with HTH and peptisase S24 domain
MTGFLALHHEWVRSACGVEPDDLALEIATGESMAPTIKDGDTLLIDTTDRTFRNFGVYLLEINDQRLVKRVQRKHDGSLVLISDNTVYQPDFVDRTNAADMAVIGRVVWAGGPI